jgi:hypothetical protein
MGAYSCNPEQAVSRTLPSGRTIDVVWSGTIGEPARVWALKYRTTVPASDPRSLDLEVAEIWEAVQSEADASGVSRARLWPVNLDSHFIHFEGWWPVHVSTHSYAFTFEKTETGVWRRVPHGASVEVGSSG